MGAKDGNGGDAEIWLGAKNDFNGLKLFVIP